MTDDWAGAGTPARQWVHATPTRTEWNGNMSTQNLERRARTELLPDVIYEVTDIPGMFGVSPDGIGMYWYDTEDELREDCGSEILAHVEITDDELEEIR